MQTPDGALLDILRNAHDLLSECNIKLPKVYLLKISSINAWQLSYPPSNCTVDMYLWSILFFNSFNYGTLFHIWNCRLKITANILILDHHFLFFYTLLLAHFGRSQGKRYVHDDLVYMIYFIFFHILFYPSIHQ